MDIPFVFIFMSLFVRLSWLYNHRLKFHNHYQEAQMRILFHNHCHLLSLSHYAFMYYAFICMYVKCQFYVWLTFMFIFRLKLCTV